MMEVLYLLKKSVHVWAVFRYDGRPYSRRCTARDGVYYFSFRGKMWPARAAYCEDGNHY